MLVVSRIDHIHHLMASPMTQPPRRCSETQAPEAVTTRRRNRPVLFPILRAEKRQTKSVMKALVPFLASPAPVHVWVARPRLFRRSHPFAWMFWSSVHRQRQWVLATASY